MHEPLEILEADLERIDHQDAVCALTAAYALDAFGNGGPLPDDVMERLIPGLRSHPTTIVFLAYAGKNPVGIATCFRGFSTFLGKPLINIHDLAVLPECRGRGIGHALLHAVEAKARAIGCGKITLEVLQTNERARNVYHRHGFDAATSDHPNDQSLFYTKYL
ncbi:MAG: GNAT family N-acetyltransferase [Planctomycetota bacterium]